MNEQETLKRKLVQSRTKLKQRVETHKLNQVQEDGYKCAQLEQ